MKFKCESETSFNQYLNAEKQRYGHVYTDVEITDLNTCLMFLSCGLSVGGYYIIVIYLSSASTIAEGYSLTDDMSIYSLLLRQDKIVSMIRVNVCLCSRVHFSFILLPKGNI